MVPPDAISDYSLYRGSLTRYVLDHHDEHALKNSQFVARAIMHGEISAVKISAVPGSCSDTARPTYRCCRCYKMLQQSIAEKARVLGRTGAGTTIQPSQHWQLFLLRLGENWQEQSHRDFVIPSLIRSMASPQFVIPGSLSISVSSGISSVHHVLIVTSKTRLRLSLNVIAL
jgi:hypothetical protein